MNSLRSIILSLVLTLVSVACAAQVVIKGTVSDPNGNGLFGVVVHVEGIHESYQTDERGHYRIAGLGPGPKKLIFFQPGFRKTEHTMDPKNGPYRLNVVLEPLAENLSEVTVSEDRATENAMTTLLPVEGTAIYAGKKTEVIQLANINANLASNRARQVFAQVAGINIWESDCGGIQIGVGGRGLSPNRTENFNTRQNGYDIAADALGYPESYYSPPMQSIKKVEVVRGAASLQYGPQFGGMLNFVMKEGADSSKFEVESEQTYGAYGFFNSYNAIGGTIGRFNYYGFFLYRFGNCWRCNSGFDNYTGYAALKYTAPSGTSLKAEYTRMWYLAQQAGGLTDTQFEQDARQATRNRNWFRVKWNLLSLSLKQNLSGMAKLDMRLFGLIGSREALGFLAPPNQSDPASNPASEPISLYRDLIHGRFRNFGAEARYLQRYTIATMPQVFLTGLRAYRGNTLNEQGAADSTAAPVFEYADIDANQNRSTHPSTNVAWFAENIFNITPNFSITPGARIEFINTRTEGEARTVYRDQAQNIVGDSLRVGESAENRWFPLFGLGLSYKPLRGMELYANFSQNYKPINFNDLWVSSPSARIDPDMKDETGFNADLGIRGEVRGIFQYDVTAFLMMYNDRIGYVQRTDEELFTVYRLRTNVSDAMTVGVESYLRWNVLRTFVPTSDWRVSVFANTTWVNARYIGSDEPAYRSNRVELTPELLLRAGLDLGWKDIKLSYLFSHTGFQYTDATNSIRTANAVNGIIPAYSVMDLNISYRYWKMTLNAGVENIADSRYFTRRATGYPGPGIIPSSGRTFYITLGIRL